MQHIIAIIALFFITVGWSQHNNYKNTIPKKTTHKTCKKLPKLTFLWETDTLLTTIESVLYDKKRHLIYASNINGHWLKKNGKGFISKIDLKGHIITEKWITGLEGTTGMTMLNDKLYVADFETIVEIDVDKGNILKRHKVEGAERINDLTVTNDGTIYASDTPKEKLFTFKNGESTLVLDSLGYPNGLLAKKEFLLIGLAKKEALFKMDYKTKILTKITEGIKYPDGIVEICEGNYIVSSWDGVIYHVTSNGEKTILLDTISENINAADMDYIPEHNMLLVPAMSSNKLMAYRLENLK